MHLHQSLTHRARRYYDSTNRQLVRILIEMIVINNVHYLQNGLDNYRMKDEGRETV